jgi:RsiW-degrading membrane proteinase PrsW (M82 family)
MEPSNLKRADLYGTWLDQQLRHQSIPRSWVLTLGLSLLAGPLAILAAFTNNAAGSEFLLLVIVGPLVEEMGKVLAPLMVIEKNPARFTSGTQPIVCALAGGLIFAVIENLLYLNVYIDDPSPMLITWRWTVCVALHTGCSFVAGCGVAKIRHHSLTDRVPPTMETGAFLIIAAVVIHGVYNFMAILIDPVFG